MAMSGADNGGIFLVALAKRQGGVDSRVHQIAAALHSTRPYVVAALAGSPVHNTLAKFGLRVLPIKYGRADPRIAWLLFREINRTRYTVIDAHNPQSYLWGMLAGVMARLPMRICTVHSVTRESDRSWVRMTLYESILRVAGQLGCQFIGISRSIGDYLESLGIPKNRIRVIPNGIDLPSSPGLPTTQVRKSLGWGPAAYVITVIGRLEPVKGHLYLFRALSELRDQYPLLRCLVVGDGRERHSLQTETVRLGLTSIVHFTGFRNDIPALLMESDLLCMPSLSEGIPYALLEAAARGVPALVSAVGGLAEILVHNKTARMVPPADAMALARELRWFIEHRERAAAIGKAARELVRERFKTAKMVSDTLAVYDGAIPGG
jgi:glycosyltransferase involved in cell wall biosynthesis